MKKLLETILCWIGIILFGIMFGVALTGCAFTDSGKVTHLATAKIPFVQLIMLTRPDEHYTPPVRRHVSWEEFVDEWGSFNNYRANQRRAQIVHMRNEIAEKGFLTRRNCSPGTEFHVRYPSGEGHTLSVKDGEITLPPNSNSFEIFNKSCK